MNQKRRLVFYAYRIWALLPLFYFQDALACGSADSLRVESLLCQAAMLPADSNKVLFFAHGLEGKPYQTGTLDTGSLEELVVRLDCFDCVTFVETVLALVRCNRLGQLSFSDFCKHLQVIRYRDGIIDSYASRLHYFSDWIWNNTHKHLVYERTGELSKKVRKLSLDFMAKHASLYPAFADSLCLDSMYKVESRWQNYAMPYIEKGRLNGLSSELDIRNGDILALTTSKEGLDVVHVGFAYWVEGKLHLLHASSLHGKVLVDPIPLFDYLEKKPNHTGVRVISLL